MKTTSLLFSVVFALASVLHAADDAALIAADKARVAATIAADRAGLEAILSDDLRYAHSSGKVDTKASLIETITSGQTKYTAFDYEERNFTYPAPGIALMTGKAQLKVGGNDLQLSFLAVWREEKGTWRFLAWQSCKLTPAAPAPAK